MDSKAAQPTFVGHGRASADAPGHHPLVLPERPVTLEGVALEHRTVTL
jgi:hypothetical protein